MITVNMHEAKTRLSELVTLIEEKHEVVRLCRNGKPVACIKAAAGNSQADRGFRSELAPLHLEGDLTAPITLEEWPADLR